MNMPIISPLWFYLAGVCGTVRFACAVLLILIPILMLIVYAIGNAATSETDREIYKKASPHYKDAVKAIAILFALEIFVPSKDTVYTMIAASTVTPANIEAAADAGENIIDYITEKIKETAEGN